MTQRKVAVFIIHETVGQSLARDAGTLAMTLAMTLPGWWLGATWLSATGFIMLWLWVMGRVMILTGRQMKTSVAEARAELDKIEREGGAT